MAHLLDWIVADNVEVSSFNMERNAESYLVNMYVSIKEGVIPSSEVSLSM